MIVINVEVLMFNIVWVMPILNILVILLWFSSNCLWPSKDLNATIYINLYRNFLSLKHEQITFYRHFTANFPIIEQE